MIKKIAEFKDRLNQALSMRNIKPVELAATTSISESTISQYRSGYAKPKEDKLAKISTALDVNPAWLMGLDVPMNEIQHNDIVIFETKWADGGGGEHPIPLDETEKKLIELYRNTDNDTRRMIDRLLEYTKATYQDGPSNPVGRAARRHTIPKKLTKNKKDNA